MLIIFASAIQMFWKRNFIHTLKTPVFISSATLVEQSPNVHQNEKFCIRSPRQVDVWRCVATSFRQVVGLFFCRRQVHLLMSILWPTPALNLFWPHLDKRPSKCPQLNFVRENDFERRLLK